MVASSPSLTAGSALKPITSPRTFCDSCNDRVEDIRRQHQVFGHDASNFSLGHLECSIERAASLMTHFTSPDRLKPHKTNTNVAASFRALRRPYCSQLQLLAGARSSPLSHFATAVLVSPPLMPTRIVHATNLGGDEGVRDDAAPHERPTDDVRAEVVIRAGGKLLPSQHPRAPPRPGDSPTALLLRSTCGRQRSLHEARQARYTMSP